MDLKTFTFSLQIILISFLARGTSGCGQRPLVDAPGGSRIVGGRFATEGAWPWQVSIQKRSSHLCGGSILNSQCVLSAAHCFKDSSTSNVRVVAGLHVQSVRGWHVQYRSVRRVDIHEEYNPTNYNNDVALLFLNSPLEFTDYVQSVCTLMNEIEELNFNFSSCFISGWGSTSYEGMVVDTLQEAEVDLIDTKICNQIDWHNGHINDNMLCAGFAAGEVDSCQGDSGGPLQCYSEDLERFFVVGVTSHGKECALPKRPGVYSRVSRYSAWLGRAQERSVSAASHVSLSTFQIISTLLSAIWIVI